MSTDGSIRAARACSHCATPISPPSTTLALFDMFCALNGTTSTPCRENHRASAVTSRLLPAVDVQPSTMSGRRIVTAGARREPGESVLRVREGMLGNELRTLHHHDGETCGAGRDELGVVTACVLRDEELDAVSRHQSRFPVDSERAAGPDDRYRTKRERLGSLNGADDEGDGLQPRERSRARAGRS